MLRPFFAWLAALSICVTTAISAQTVVAPAAAPTATPATAAATGPAVTPAAGAAPAQSAAPMAYRSAFDGYQPYADKKITPWKESNDTVGRIGGWRAYAKEVQESQAKDAGRSAAPAGAADPHAGHHKP